MTERIHAIHALDNRITAWWATVPQMFQLSAESVPKLGPDILPNILLINAAYHQCLCALHSSIIPLFSWSADDNSWLSARPVSAQIAFEHACAASAIFKAVLEHYPRLSALPSFVGYTAYGGCAIQIPFLWCLELAVRARAHSNVQANISIIHTMARYWKFASLSVSLGLV